MDDKVYAEKYVGFWLSYTLPTILFVICPMVLIAFKSKYVRHPPTGSVLGKAVGLFFLAWKKSGYKLRSTPGFVSTPLFISYGKLQLQASAPN